jgi:hypothetical protein
VLDAPTAADAEALARAHDVRTLLRVTVQLDGLKLSARGDAIHTWVNFWSGATTTRIAPSATLNANVDADAQALALGATMPTAPAPLGPLKLSLTSLARLSAVPAALAFGDLDGDGKGELAVLQEDGVAVLDLDGKLKARADLHELPSAISPSREPFGALAVLSSPPRLVVASSRKARPAVLTFKAGRVEATPVAEAPAELPRPTIGLNVFERGLTLSGKMIELPGPFTTTSTRGATTLIVYPDGSAMLSDGTLPSTRLGGAGAGSALADLDGDGVPEVLLSSTRYACDGDELKVLSLTQALALQARSASAVESPVLWSGATPRGRTIAALSADLDGDKVDEVVLGVWLSDGTGELLVVRAR